MASTALKKIGKALQYWYIPMAIGIIFLVLGIWSILNPADSFGTMSWMFSFSFILSGIMEVFFSISNRKEIDGWGWHLAGGLFDLFLGLILLNNPGINAVMLSILVGFFVLYRSIGAISKSIEIKNYGEGSWLLMMLLGILGVFFSFMILKNIGAATAATVISTGIWIGLSMISLGLFALNFSILMRKLKNLA